MEAWTVEPFTLAVQVELFGRKGEMKLNGYITVTWATQPGLMTVSLVQVSPELGEGATCVT
jgi:hypothetical protein